MTALAQQFGMKAESVFGTAVTPDRFYEVKGESLRHDIGRTRSAGLRSAQRTDRTDRFLPFITGVSGGWSMDVATKGMGVLLKQIFGTAAIGGATDSNYTQTFTVGTLLGKFFTCQVNRPLMDATDQAFTFKSCKIAAATFACDVDGVLTLDVTVIGQDMTTGTVLATVAYPSDFRVFSFANAAMTVAGTSTPMKGWSVTINNQLAMRRMVQGSALTLEPVRTAMRTIEVSWTAEFTSLTDYNRYKSATAAGALASVVATFTGDVVHGGATLPQIVCTTPNLDFMEVTGPNLSEANILTAQFKGLALDDGSLEPITFTYRTTDAAA